MGIFDSIMRQTIDVIEWTDSTEKTMVHKYDMLGKEIMMGAQLIVRESQVAIFVNEGQIADVFAPGRYELQTANMPILTKLQSWKYGFQSPFKCDVYFINTKQFLDCKWGTSNPVMMRDPEFGMIRIRAFGTYSFKVNHPVVFMKECFGTASLYTTEGVEGQIKSIIVSGLSSALAGSTLPALDFASNYGNLSEQCRVSLNPEVEKLGLTLCSFVIENISLPEEVEKAIDRRTSMGVVGDLNTYAKYQAAESIREAANNQNGMAGVGAGLGAAAVMGQMMGHVDTFSPAAATIVCGACHQAIPTGSKFCPLCGARQAAQAKIFCSKCGKELEAGTLFCSNCGNKLG